MANFQEKHNIFSEKGIFQSYFSKKEVFLWIKIIHVIAIIMRTIFRAASAVLWGPKETRGRQVPRVSKGIPVVLALRGTEGNRGRLALRVFQALPVQGDQEEIQVR